MTPKKRLQTCLQGGLPDCVPVAPDTSNMIPAKLTNKPFWDLYLYQDPPIWKAYIDCVKTFGFDSLMDGYAPIHLDEPSEQANPWIQAIVEKTDRHIITQRYQKHNRERVWENTASVYHKDQPPAHGILLKSLKRPHIPERFEDVTGVKTWPKGAALLSYVKKELGDHGLVGVQCGTSKLLHSERDIYAYYDNPRPFWDMRDRLLEEVQKRFFRLMALEDKPDFICTGGSGTLIHQNIPIFRELALPIVKTICSLCKKAGIPSHIHSCGPQKELIKILYEETDLTVIDPLEPPPMGDCNLAELKRLYGDKLVLKGNLHTTDVMLFGSVPDVRTACKKAIDDAAKGGRFILSTGDQCGRDTPFENIYAMIETAREYGRY